MNLRVPLIAVAPLSACFWIGALAEATYEHLDLEFETLGTLGPGYAESEARDVSEYGDIIVGRSFTTGFHGNLSGFRWEYGEMTTLEALDTGQSTTAWAISPDGSVIVGIAGHDGDLVPAIWTNGRIHALLDEQNSTANDVTRRGDMIVGTRKTILDPSNYRAEGFFVQPGPFYTYDIIRMAKPDDPGRLFHSVANAVTPDGSIVVGNRYTNMLEPVAVYWWTESPTDPVYFAFGNTEALGVSQTGKVIVGKNNDIATAWFFEEGELTRTVTMPGIDYQQISFVQDVSHDGSVLVGSMVTTELDEMVPVTEENAVIWFVSDSDGQQVEGPFILDQVIDLNRVTELDGFHCVVAYAVSGDGSTVVGYGINAQGNREAFRLSGLNFPTENPPDAVTTGPYENTGPFLGWLHTEYAPWYWCYPLDSWVYVPGESMTARSGWVYTLR